MQVLFGPLRYAGLANLQYHRTDFPFEKRVQPYPSLDKTSVFKNEAPPSRRISLCCSIINMMFSSDTLSKNEDGLTQNSRYVEWLLSDIATSRFLIFFGHSTRASSVVEPPAAAP